MNTNDATIAAQGIKQGAEVAQDIGIALMSLGPIPLTVLVGLIFGLMLKSIFVGVGIEKAHKILIPLFIICVCSFTFWALTDPSEVASAPFTMRYPEIRIFIVGALLGFGSIVIHQRFIKDSKIERWVTGETVDVKPSQE